MEVSARDAEELGLGEGDLVSVTSPRGALQGRLRVTKIRPGLLFVPFHYGYWDTPAGSGPDDRTPPRTANELTATAWDPVSKQPLFKTATAALTLIAKSDDESSPAPSTVASSPKRSGSGRPRRGRRVAPYTGEHRPARERRRDGGGLMGADAP